MIAVILAWPALALVAALALGRIIATADRMAQSGNHHD